MMPPTPSNSTNQTRALTRRDFLRGLAGLIGLVLIRFETASAGFNAWSAPREFAWDQSGFASRVNDAFRCDFGRARIHTLKLLQVRDQVAKIHYQSGRIANASAAANYLLVFRGPRNDSITQGTFQFSHVELGAFFLFIVPGDADENGQHYVAVINHLDIAQPTFNPPTDEGTRVESQ